MGREVSEEVIAAIVLGEANREKAISPGKVMGLHVQLETAMPPITLRCRALGECLCQEQRTERTTEQRSQTCQLPPCGTQSQVMARKGSWEGTPDSEEEL